MDIILSLPLDLGAVVICLRERIKCLKVLDVRCGHELGWRCSCSDEEGCAKQWCGAGLRADGVDGEAGEEVAMAL